MGEDTPTVRLDAADPEPEKKEDRSKTLIIVLAVVGVLLLLAVAVLLTLIFSGALNQPAEQPKADAPQSQSPSPSDEPSSTPSETPSESPSASPSATPSSAPPAPPAPPAETGPRFKTFSYPASQQCSVGGPGFPATVPAFKVSWTTAGAVEAWFVNGTDDAANSGYMQIPLNGNQSNFPYEQIVDCSDGSNTYTITLVGPDGKHVSKTWTVNITGDHF